MGDVNKTIWQSVAQQGKPVAYVLAFTSTLSYGALAQAQIVPDAVGTDNGLGTTVTSITLGDGVIGEGPAELIGGGTPGGSNNLFHSFSEFNVGAGQRVYFSNPAGITDILSRVTGGSGSTIDGVLGIISDDLQSIGSANLFLLNPNGVVFGPGAELQLNGSFTATTAGESISFADGQVFGISTPGTELLTFSTPPGVQFNAPLSEGDITNNASNLAVAAGQTLTLFGDSLLNNGGLAAPSGTVEVVGDQFTLGSAASISTIGDAPGGAIFVRADEIDLASGSTISGVGDLVLQPLMLGTGVVLGGTTVPMDLVLDLTAEDLQAIENGGFSSILIGRDDLIGNISLAGNVGFSDPLTLSTLGSINANGRTFTGSDNASLSLRAGAGIAVGAISTDGAPIFIDGDINRDGTGSVTVNQSISTAGGNLNILGTSPTAGGIVTLAPIDVGTGNITFTTDNPLVGSTISGTGELQFSPFSPDLAINLGGEGDSNFSFLNQAEINRLADGFSGITIGSIDATGDITLVGDTTFADPVTLLTSGAIDTNGGSLTGDDDASIFLVAGTGVNAGAIATSGNEVFILGDVDGDVNVANDANGSVVINQPISTAGGPIFLVGLDTTTNESGVRTTANGVLNSGGGNIDVNGTSALAPGVDIQGAISSLGGNIFIFGDSDSGNVADVVITAPISSGVGNILLIADDPSLQNSISGSGDLRIEPFSFDPPITLGGADGFLSQAELAQFNDGFRSITVGSEDFGGDISLRGDVVFNDSTTLLASGIIDTTGGVIFGDGDASITLLAITETPEAIGIEAGEINTVASGEDITLVSNGRISTNGLLQSGNDLRFLDLSGNPSRVVSINSPLFSATSDIVFGNYEGPALKLQTIGNINVGDITITGPNAGAVNNSSGADSNLLASSRAAILRAGDNLADGFNASQATSASPNSGNISVGFINTSDIEGGDGGSIILEAAGDVTTTDFFNSPFDAPFSLGSFSYSESDDAGTGGDILVQAGGEINGSIGIIGSLSFSESGDSGPGGNIQIQAGEDIYIPGGLVSPSSSESGDSGLGGNVQIQAGEDIEIAGGIDSSSFGLNSGNGGQIVLEVEEGNIDASDISLTSFSSSIGGGSGSGGEISLRAENGSIDIANSSLSSSSSSSSFDSDSGNGGDIVLSVKNDIDGSNSRVNSFSFASEGSSGDGGNIVISAGGNVEFPDSFLDSSTSASIGSSGDGGSIILNAEDDIDILSGSLNSSASSSLGEESGDGGDILAESGGDITIGSTDSSGKVNDVSSGFGNDAGRLDLNAVGNILFGQHSGNAFGDGIGSNVVISGASVVIDGTIDPANFQGPGGTTGNTTIVSTTGDIVLDRITIFGDSGFDDTSDSANTLISRGGDIVLDSARNIELRDSTLDSTYNGSSEFAGNTTLIARNGDIRVLGDSLVSTDTRTGAAGSITLDARNGQILLDGPGLNPKVEGFALSLEFQANALPNNASFQPIASQIQDLAANIDVLASDSKAFSAMGPGFVSEINALASEIEGLDSAPDFDFSELDFVALELSAIASEIQLESDPSNTGRFTPNPIVTASVLAPINGMLGNGNIDPNVTGGDIEIITLQLNVIDGSDISASTFGVGNGGNISVNADNVVLDNRGVIEASTSGTGNGGSLAIRNLNDDLLTIRGDGELTVESRASSGGQAGSLDIATTSLRLSEGVTLSASSESSSGGGNIIIDVSENVFMADGSLIRADNNNQDAGNGGNITIDAEKGFFVTLSTGNNDIIANAEGGNGGVIRLSAERIFGLLERRGVDADTLRNNILSEVSASSTAGGIDGEVTLLNLSFDPTQGLNQLPGDLTDQANQIAQGCRANSSGLASETDQSEFVITGRGGLPASPSDSISADLDSVPWVTVPDGNSPSVSTEPTTPSAVKPLLEAQGWTTRADGEIFFVADATTTTAPQLSGLPTASLCSASL